MSGLGVDIVNVWQGAAGYWFMFDDVDNVKVWHGAFDVVLMQGSMITIWVDVPLHPGIAAVVLG